MAATQCNSRCASLIAYTERIVRKSVEEIPDGVYEAEDYADTDGFSPDPIKIKVKLTVKGSDITVDFTGSDPICKGSINSPYANTASAAFYSLQFFLAPHAPSNAGMFAPINLVIPEGTWLNPVWPAPTIGCTTLASSKITSAIWQALAKAIPERVTGSTCSECNWFVSTTVDRASRTGGSVLGPARRRLGRHPFNDGMNVTMDPLGNCMNMAAETAELFFPIEYEASICVRTRPGRASSAAVLGAVFKVRYLCEGELNMETSRTRKGSPGVNGGGSQRGAAFDPPLPRWQPQGHRRSVAQRRLDQPASVRTCLQQRGTVPVRKHWRRWLGSGDRASGRQGAG
jgi:N-methylhydantoinase B